MKKMIGLSVGSGTKGVDAASFAAYRAAGIDAVELSLLGLSLGDAYKAQDFCAIAATARAEGVVPWSFHLPFAPFESVDIASLDEQVRTHTVKELSKLLRRVADAGIGIAVIHPSAEPNAPENRARHIAAAKESLFSLARTAKEAGVTLAVEDLPRTCIGNCSAEILELTSVDAALRVCFDTNHLLFEDPVDFVRAVGDKIVTLHVSDYDFVNERHWLPGEGRVEWQALLRTLDKVGYEGPFLYEIGFEAPATIVRPRALVPSDFVQNARELFSGAPLTVLGKSCV